MKVRIVVTLKPGVLDPQGKAIHKSLEGLGFGGINDVRAGKVIELDVADTVTDDELDGMCRKLIANTVIENYRIEASPEKVGIGFSSGDATAKDER
jgi:phosphoribosylformylglycinamidine synthase PurS subunit